MGRLDREARNAMAALLERGHTKSDVARLLGVGEGTVGYHGRRLREGSVDGRGAGQCPGLIIHIRRAAHPDSRSQCTSDAAMPGAVDAPNRRAGIESYPHSSRVGAVRPKILFCSAFDQLIVSEILSTISLYS